MCGSSVGRYAAPATFGGEREVIVGMVVVRCLRDLSEPFSVKVKLADERVLVSLMFSD